MTTMRSSIQINDLNILTRQRSNGHELHNIAALMGGIAAQEAVKIISHQYIPAENTILYDGVYSKTACLKL
jgi:amyloid beta precursor protein binding protein 1